MPQIQYRNLFPDYGDWLFAVLRGPRGYLLSLFHASSEMLEIGIPALRIIAVSFLPASIGFILPTMFQAMGNGIDSLIVFLLRQFVITLPLAWFLHRAVRSDRNLGIFYSG